MWLVGFLIEAISDQQKLQFKKYSTNTERWCNIGFWKWSRHPNYFGEILLWWWVFVASTPLLEGAKWLAVTGPIFLTTLLLFLSGIPLLEYSADKKFGGLTEYREYKRKTRSVPENLIWTASFNNHYMNMQCSTRQYLFPCMIVEA